MCSYSLCLLCGSCTSQDTGANTEDNIHYFSSPPIRSRQNPHNPLSKKPGARCSLPHDVWVQPELPTVQDPTLRQAVGPLTPARILLSHHNVSATLPGDVDVPNSTDPTCFHNGTLHSRQCIFKLRTHLNQERILTKETSPRPCHVHSDHD